jgi:tetrahydromethanopterin S-methyltransferase subunit F|tara:strand:+ start:254 stop:445 length:192 start_codon:yes stop_codon:yes gene_type:complete
MGIYHNLLYFTLDKQKVHAVSNKIEEVKYNSGLGGKQKGMGVGFNTTISGFIIRGCIYCIMKN